MSYTINQDWINEEKVNYFNILDFISKIKLDKRVLYQMEETGNNFEEYLKTLSKYCNDDDFIIIYYLLDLASQELLDSSKIENHIFNSVDILDGNLFFEKLSISHERIKRIHKFVCNHSHVDCDNVGEYRKKSVSVGAYYGETYQPYWYAPEAEDVKKFMDDYITFYKFNSVKDIYNNPFLKSALAHLLFVRIHPFKDGNGRTARIIQNISFTNNINKIYNTKLKLSPINISQNILINKLTYADSINKIHFNLDYENNEHVNNWFRFILNMYDEQLYYQSQRIPEYIETIEEIKNNKNDDENINQIIKKFKMKGIMRK